MDEQTHTGQVPDGETRAERVRRVARDVSVRDADALRRLSENER